MGTPFSRMTHEEQTNAFARAVSAPENPNPFMLRSGNKPKRNAKCPCGSGAKYKRCCGKVAKTPSRVVPKSVSMKDLFTPEQVEASKDFLRRYGFQPNPTQLQVFMEGDEDECKRMVKTAILRAAEMASGEEPPADNKFAYVVDKLNMLVTPMNKPMLTDEEKQLYTETLQEWQREHGETVAESGSEGVPPA